MNTGDLIELWLQDVDPELLPVIRDVFNRWGRGGSVVEEVYDEDDMPHMLIKTYVPAGDIEPLRQIEIGLALADQVQPAKDKSLLSSLQRRVLAETDWSEAWKASYQVMHIGRHIVIKPSWHSYEPDPADLVIELDPGMAFGSGLHQTTRLCLQALEDTVQPKAQVLDVGTGSGILAIAAAKLGAGRVLALDTDPLAVRVTLQNIDLNEQQAAISVRQGSLTGENEPVAELSGVGWDVIVANILAGPLIEMAAAFQRHLRPGGSLILSGITSRQVQEVSQAMQQYGLQPLRTLLDSDWAALLLER